MSIAVAAGQRVTGMRIAMAPTGTISGRVFGEDGEPAGRVQVLALRIVYRDGQPVMTIAESVITNDRGEYRLFWLPPASYRVAAKAWNEASNYPAVNIGPPKRFGLAELGAPPVVSRRSLENGAVVEETYRPMYAPGTADPQTAATITLAPGESVSADIQLAGNRVPVHHVRGTVANITGEQTRFPKQVQVVPRAPLPMVAIPNATLRADGSFDVAGVPPGSHTIYVSDGDGVLPIEVGDVDIDNIVITLSNGISISGRITAEGGASGGGSIDLSRLRFLLDRDPDVVGTPPGGVAFNPPVGADGAFTLGGIRPGDYRVSLFPILNRTTEFSGEAGFFLSRQATSSIETQRLENAYVKSMRWGKVDVLTDGLHTLTPTQGSLDIVIGLNGAELEGTVIDNARQPAVNVVVVAVPEGEFRGRGDLYRSAASDRSGHFGFRGMVPGDYSVYVWPAVERGAWQNAEFMHAYEGLGRFVRLREGQNDPVELSVIAR
jgi:hypothetical protein